jgi:hypothetical protein
VHLVERGGIGDTRRLEHLLPPGDSLFERGKGRTHTVRVRVAEHDVVRSAFGREHGVVACLQAAAAGDALRLEMFERLGEDADPGDMRAVRPAARDEIDVAVEQQRGAAVLAERREPLDPVDALALVARPEPQHDRGDLGSGQGVRQRSRKRLRVPDGRRDQHEARLRTRLGLFRAGSHAGGDVSAIRRDWGDEDVFRYYVSRSILMP